MQDSNQYKSIVACLQCIFAGASAADEDEQFEGGVVESNCVYRLVEDRLVPHEEAWACIPCVSLLDSNEVRLLCFIRSFVHAFHLM